METRPIMITAGIVFTCLMIVLLAQSKDADAKTWIVDKEGNGDFTTIQEAIENATDGDTLRVYDGDYHGNLIINKQLSLVGNGSASVRVIGEGNNDVIRITKDDVRVSGITVMNSGKTPDAAGIEILGWNSVVSFCNLSGNNGSGILIKNNGNNTISNSVISGNGRYGIVLTSAHNTTIENNTCDDNVWVGIMLMSSSKDNTVRNNSCTLGDDAYGILLYSGSDNNLVVNNTIRSSGYALTLWETTNNTLRSNEMIGSGINLDYLGDGTPDEPLWMKHEIDDSNVLNGNKVYYTIDASNISVPDGMGQIIIVNGTAIEIKDQACVNGSIGITIGYSTDISLENVDASGNIREGMWIISSRDVHVVNSTFSRNGNGIRLEGPSSSIVLEGSHINGNILGGINATDIEDTSVNATRIWWGHVTGPYQATINPEGEGNMVTDNVEFGDWIDWPPYGDYAVPMAFISLSPDDIVKGTPVNMNGTVTTSTPISTYAWSSSINGEFYNGSVASFIKYDYLVRKGFESDNLSMNTSGDAPWVITGTEWKSGDRSAMSGDITNDETSVLEMNVHGMGNLAFQWKADSEPGYDFLRLYVDGILIDEITGDVNWAPYSINLSVGDHDIRWSYEKDGSYSWGEDAGYVDDIVFRSLNTLSNGTHTVSLRVRDEYGIWSDENSTSLIINGRPVGLIDSISPNPALDVDTIEFRATASDDGTIERYVWTSSLDGEFSNVTNSTITNSDLSNGSHIITLVVQDDRGVWSIPHEASLVVNGKPIGTIVSIFPSPALDVESVQFVANGTDDGSIVRYRWRSSIDGEFYNGTKASFSSGDLSNGTHRIDMAVQDDMGVWSNEDTGYLTINGKPVVRIEEISPSPALDIDNLSLLAKGSDDGNITRYVWRSSRDGEFYNDSDPGFTYGDLTNGTHIIFVRVQDNNGTWSDEVNMELIVNGKPVARIEAVRPDPALDRDNITLNGNGSDDGTIARYLWTSSIDGIIQNGTSGEVQTDSLSNGTHTLTFRVRDEMGVWSENVTYELVVNGVPVVRITSISPSPALDIDTIDFTSEASDDGTVVRYVWRTSIDGGGGHEIYNGTNSSFSADWLSNGSHIITLQVLDDFGTWSDSVQTTLDINGKPRAFIESVTPSPALDIDTVVFNATAHDDGTVVRFVWRSDIDGEQYNGTESSFESDTLSNGTHIITFRVLDDNGTWSDVETIELVVNGKPVAVLKSVVPNPALDIDTLTFTGNGTDDGSIIRYHWTSSLDGVFYNGTNATFERPSLSNGTHGISFAVMDNNGTWSDEVSTLLMINGRPVARIDSVTPNPALDLDVITFNGSGTDDGDIVRYLWTSSLDGTLSNGTEPTFASGNLTNGTHVIGLAVLDNNGTWSEVEIVLLRVNGKPVTWIEEVTPNPAVDDSLVRLSGNGSDDGSIVRYVWNSSIDGLFYDGTNAIIGIDTLSNGSHTLTLRVMDDDGTWSDEVSAILEVNGRPVARIGSISPDPARDSDVIEFRGSGTDDGNVVRYVWNSSIDGELHNDTGSDFQSGNLSNGTHLITLKVQDDKGIWSEDAYRVIKVNGIPIPMILSMAPNPAPDDQDVRFTASVVDDGNIELYAWRSARDRLEFYNGTEADFFFHGLSNGTHSIFLKVLDDQGIWSAEVTDTLIVNGRPVARIEEVTPNPSLSGSMIHFTGNGIDDGSVVRYVWESNLDGVVYDGPESSFQHDSLSNGTHILMFRVLDNFGVWSFPDSYQLRIFGRPVATIVSIIPDPVREGDPVHFIGHGTDDGEITRYIWNSSMDGEIYNGSIPEFDIENLSIGLHTIYLQVVDDQGLYSLWATGNIQVYREPSASIAMIQPNLTQIGEPITFTGNSSDPDNITAYHWRSSIDGIFSNDSANIVVYDGLSNGTHTIYLKVLNRYGAWSGEVFQVVTILRRPIAVIDEISPNPAKEGASLTMKGHGNTDIKDAVVRYRWRSNRDGIVYDGPEKTIAISSLSIGQHTLFFRVQTENGFWSDEADAQVEIGIRNVRPEVNVIEPVSGSVVKGMVTVSGTSDDADDDVVMVEFSIDGGEWQAANGTDTWTFVVNTTDLVNGVHYVRARAFDDIEYSLVAEINIIVDNEEGGDGDEGGGIFMAILVLVLILLLVVVISLYLFRSEGSGGKKTGDGPAGKGSGKSGGSETKNEPAVMDKTGETGKEMDALEKSSETETKPAPEKMGTLEKGPGAVTKPAQEKMDDGIRGDDKKPIA